MTVFHGDLTPIDIVHIFCQGKAPGGIISGFNKEIARIRQAIRRDGESKGDCLVDEASHFRGEAKTPLL